MNQFTVLKCPSCGSSVIETDNEKIAECSHCGSLLLMNNNKSSQNEQYPELIITLMLLIIVGRILGFYLTQNREEIKQAKTKIEVPKIEIPDVEFNLPKVNSKAMTITQDDLTKNKVIEPKITTVHHVQGKTTIGGIYWIITVRNDSDKTIIRLGACPRTGIVVKESWV